MKFYHFLKLIRGTNCAEKLTFTKWNTLRRMTSATIQNRNTTLHPSGRGIHVLQPIQHINKCFKYNLLSGIPAQICRFKSSNHEFPYKEDIFIQYLDSLAEEYNEITQSVNREKVDRKRELFLQPLIAIYGEYKQKVKDREDLKELESGSTGDEELNVLMEEERKEVNNQIDELKTQIIELLLPLETTDENDVILEVNPGVGGQEACHFTKDIFEMYQSYAQYKGWAFDIMEYDSTASDGAVGLRSASASISGLNVYKLMKFESGVHRVQRVPKTEAKGRVHTSTMTVAVLPQPNEINIDVKKSDLKIETYRASGKGGQGVNTTDSAVRIIHLPTGIKCECQVERSQAQNLNLAMKKLYTRIYDAELTKQVTSIQRQRKIQVGSAARSEKIRTYNFNQNRITEHRIHHSMFDMEGFMNGSELLDDMIHLLLKESRQEVLVETLENFEKQLHASNKLKLK